MTKTSLLLLFSAAALAAAQDDGDGGGMPDFGGAGGGGMPDFGKPKACPPFRCSSGHSAVPKSRQKFDSTGCNSMGMGMQMFSGAGGAKDDSRTIGPCCDKWHACYQICGASKTGCDEAFKKCGDGACKGVANDQEKKDCEQTASMNSMMLGLGDCRKYDDAQRAACQCVASDKVKGYRRDAIRGFYKKFAPDGMDDEKIKALAGKADTRGKLAGLFQKLVAKYPKCIKKVKDPQQDYMENMMKQAKTEKKDEAVETESDDGGAAEEEDDSDETQEL